jgi:hypothetical protein
MASHEEEYDWRDEPEDRWAPDNLLPPILGLIGIGALACATWALGLPDATSNEKLSYCAAITDEYSRLACYDDLASPRPPLKGAFAPPLNVHPQEK